MKQEGDNRSISQCSMCVDGSDERIFFILLQVSWSSCLFREKLHHVGWIILNELLLHSPSKIAFEAHECSVNARRLQPERRLEVSSIANQQRGCNSLRCKKPLILFMPRAFTPRQKLAQIAQIITNSRGFEIFYLLEDISILIKGLLTFDR